MHVPHAFVLGSLHRILGITVTRMSEDGRKTPEIKERSDGKQAPAMFTRGNLQHISDIELVNGLESYPCMNAYCIAGSVVFVAFLRVYLHLQHSNLRHGTLEMIN